MTLKEDILELFSQNLSYKEIARRLNCSTSTVSYYCTPGQKEKNTARRDLWRKADPIRLKMLNFQQRSHVEKEKEHSSSWLKRAQAKARDFQRRIEFSNEMKKVSDKTFSFKDVFDKYSGSMAVCYLTGDPIDLSKPESYAFDHIIPVSKGGDNSIENLGIATAEANHAKHALSIEDFLNLCEKVLRNYGRL